MSRRYNIKMSDTRSGKRFEHPDKFVADLIECMMKFSSHKMVVSADERGEMFLIRAEKSASEPPRILRGLRMIRWFWLYRWSRVICLLFAACAVAKYFCLFVVRLRFDVATSSLQKSLNLKYNGTTVSAVTLINYEQYSHLLTQDLQSSMAQDKHRLLTLGDPFIHLKGESEAYYWHAVSFIIVLILGETYVNQSKSVYCEITALWYNPHEVKCYIDDEINRVGRKLCESTLRIAKHFDRYKSMDGETQGSKSIGIESRIKFIFDRIQAKRLVEPSNLSSEWIESIFGCTNRFIRYGSIVSFFLISTRLMVFLYDECQFNSKTDSRVPLNWATLVSRIECFIAGYYVFIWSNYMVVITLVSYLHRRKWIQQILRQQEDCVKKASNIKLIDDELLTMILVTIINFEVYAKTYHYYKSFTSYLMRMITFFYVQYCCLFYMRNISFGPPDPIHFYNDMLVCMTADNVFLGAYANILKDTLKFINRIPALLCSLNSMENYEEFKPIVLQLRRYLMKRNYSHGMFTVTLFGIPLTADTQQKYISYRVGLFLYYSRHLMK